jgi:hypothetical protein
VTEAEARELLAQRWIDRWPTEAPGVPFMLDNELAVSGDEFASLSIRFVSGRGQTTAGPVGSRRWARAGNLYVRIWTVADRGATGGSALCDAARRVFEGIDLSVPAGGEPVVIEAGDSQPAMTDARWWMNTVIFRFSYTQTR